MKVEIEKYEHICNQINNVNDQIQMRREINKKKLGYKEKPTCDKIFDTQQRRIKRKSRISKEFQQLFCI